MVRTKSERVEVVAAVVAALFAACSDRGSQAPVAPATTGPTPSGAPTPAPSPIPSPPAAGPATPPPLSGGTLLLSRNGKLALAADPDRDRIHVVDLSAGKLQASVALEAGAEPGRAVEDGDGRFHVALRGAGALLTVDPREGKTVMRRALCPAPRGLAYDEGRRLLHLACAGGELVTIAPMAEAPERVLRLDRDLRDVMVSGERLLVTTFRKAEVLVVDGTGMTKKLTSPRVRSAFSSVPRKRTPGSAPAGDGLDASAAIAWRLLPGAGGQAMMLHQRGVDSEIGTEAGSYAGGMACAGIVESTISAVDVREGEAAVRSGPALGGVVLPVDMALSPDGRQIAVVSAGHAGQDQQLRFYASDSAMTGAAPGRPCVTGGPLPVPPKAPGEMVMPPGDGLPDPIEYRPPNGEVIAVAFDLRGNVVVQSREPATLQVLTQRMAPIVLSDEVRADPGHQVFHAATSGMVACASCHPEGGEDGRSWLFVGLGARRTQSLRGGIMDTAPFHWNGELPTLDHLMHDVFQGRMGGSKMDRERVTALGRWMDRIPSLKPSRWHDAAAVARGKALFESAAVGCATCHGGADFTIGSSFDVGTGGVFQVPQLHSLAFRAPYMHDGCAATLSDRFSDKCGGGDRHGVTSKLSPAQVGDLVAYLESL